MISLRYRLCHEYFGPDATKKNKKGLVWCLSKSIHKCKQQEKNLFIIVVSIASVVKCFAQERVKSDKLKVLSYVTSQVKSQIKSLKFSITLTQRIVQESF